MTHQEVKARKKVAKQLAFQRAEQQLDLEQQIVKAYESGDFLTKHIAEKFEVSSRQVQRICKKWGVLRTQQAGAAVAGPLGPRHRLQGKSKDYSIGSGPFRDIVIYTLKRMGRDFTKCEWCGKPLKDGKFQLHHTKYEGATVDDLMIICQQCNLIPQNRFLE
jgi:hypothetical protein